MEPVDRLPAHWPYDVSRRDAARVLGEVERWVHVDAERVAVHLHMDVRVVRICLFALVECGLLVRGAVRPPRLSADHAWLRPNGNGSIPIRANEPERPGCKPRPSTLRLRIKLQEDQADGGLRDNPNYVRWLMDLDPEVALAVARQTVYRERKRMP